MALPIDLTGQTYGLWHIDSLAYVKRYDKYYNCTCKCGTKKIVLGQNIRSGKSRSCGCIKAQSTFDSCFLDRTGKRYNRLTCLEWERRDGEIYWKCRCDCGNTTWVRSDNLASGAVKSCGCAINHVNAVHGMSHTRIHRIWSGMNDRCSNPNSDKYLWYGGRGISVCKEWQGTEGFIRFNEWANSHGYAGNLTIERKDVNKGYSPDNCCWVTQKEQMQNTTKTIKINLHGKEYSINELSTIYNVPYKLLHGRLRRGWSAEEAVELVPRKRRKR